MTIQERDRLLRVAKAAKLKRQSQINGITRDEPLALSYAQQRLWFLAQMEGAGQTYHIRLGLRLNGQLNLEALRRALDRVVARHEALRATFMQVNGQPFNASLLKRSALRCRSMTCVISTATQRENWNG